MMAKPILVPPRLVLLLLLSLLLLALSSPTHGGSVVPASDVTTGRTPAPFRPGSDTAVGVDARHLQAECRTGTCWDQKVQSCTWECSWGGGNPGPAQTPRPTARPTARPTTSPTRGRTSQNDLQLKFKDVPAGYYMSSSVRSGLLSLLNTMQKKALDEMYGIELLELKFSGGQALQDVIRADGSSSGTLYLPLTSSVRLSDDLQDSAVLALILGAMKDRNPEVFVYEYLMMVDGDNFAEADFFEVDDITAEAYDPADFTGLNTIHELQIILQNMPSGYALTSTMRAGLLDVVADILDGVLDDVGAEFVEVAYSGNELLRRDGRDRQRLLLRQSRRRLDAMYVPLQAQVRGAAGLDDTALKIMINTISTKKADIYTYLRGADPNAFRNTDFDADGIIVGTFDSYDEFLLAYPVRIAETDEDVAEDDPKVGFPAWAIPLIILAILLPCALYLLYICCCKEVHEEEEKYEDIQAPYKDPRQRTVVVKRERERERERERKRREVPKHHHREQRQDHRERRRGRSEDNERKRGRSTDSERSRRSADNGRSKRSASTGKSRRERERPATHHNRHVAALVTVAEASETFTVAGDDARAIVGADPDGFMGAMVPYGASPSRGGTDPDATAVVSVVPYTHQLSHINHVVVPYAHPSSRESVDPDGFSDVALSRLTWQVSEDPSAAGSYAPKSTPEFKDGYGGSYAPKSTPEFQDGYGGSYAPKTTPGFQDSYAASQPDPSCKGSVVDRESKANAKDDDSSTSSIPW